MSDQDSSSSSSSAIVQLGFSHPLTSTTDNTPSFHFTHSSPHWSHWDGGKIGGKPIWLNPRDIPTVTPLVCPTCHDDCNKSTPLRFLCQIYCPTDDDDDDDEAPAFHRTLYVFACPSSSNHNDGTGAMVLRCQLPRTNEFYPFHGKQQIEALENEKNNVPKRNWNVRLCHVCGQRSKGTCPIQSLQFCGKVCQSYHMKHVFQNKKKEENHKENDHSHENNNNKKSATSPKPKSIPMMMYHESELVVEDEPPPKSSSTLPSSLQDDNDNDDEIMNLTQNEWQNMTLSQTTCTDSQTLEFQSRIHDREYNVQHQCLRYLRWPFKRTTQEERIELGAPLWIGDECQPRQETVPDCDYCGSERGFEFQIMPQMLYYLKHGHEKQQEEQMEEVGKELDWGVIAVYTCTNSCQVNSETNNGGMGAYAMEFAWRQPSIG